MAKKTLLTAAIATGVVAGDALARDAITGPADEIDIITSELDFYGGIVAHPEDTDSFYIDDLTGDTLIPVTDDVVPEMELAQTLYGGVPDDKLIGGGVKAPKIGGGQRIQKPGKGITLDNGIKQKGKLQTREQANRRKKKKK